MEEDEEKFTFKQVIPGSYVVEIENPAPKSSGYSGDAWCWEGGNRKVVTVSANDITDIRFVQKGWTLPINCSHNVQTTIGHDVEAPLYLDIKKGLHANCLPASGEWTMMFMDQCVFFGALLRPYHTDKIEVVELVAKAYLLQGTLNVDTRLYKDGNNLTDYMVPGIFNESGSPIDQRTYARLRKKANATHPIAEYEYVYWANFGDRLMLKPRHNGNIQEEAISLDLEDNAQQGEEAEAEGEYEPEQPSASESAPLSSKDGAGRLPDPKKFPKQAEKMREMMAKQNGPTLREILSMPGVNNPGITGKVEDMDELQKAQRRGQVEEDEEEVEPKPATDSSTSDESTGSLPSETTLDSADMEITPPSYDDVDEAEEAYWESLPPNARPFADPEETWPPRKRMLFYPRSLYVNVDVEDCQPPIAPFEARVGQYLEGKVVPPLAGVNITVVTDSGSANGDWPAGSEVAWALTQEEGLYVAGPLYDDATYSVKAHKEGYEIRPLDSLSFEAQRLAHIRVSILPGLGAETPLPSVLLSLSGDNGYRQNLPTPPGDGLLFQGLFPGSFYLRPLLKEYSFEPSAAAIDLEAGEAKEVTFEAQRVAFSVVGRISSLAGQAEEGVPVEARSLEGGRYETAVSDSRGLYRLRGLLPNTTYTIAVVLKGAAAGGAASTDAAPVVSRIERASPAVVDVKITGDATEEVDFIVFDQPSTGILTGTVEGAEFDKWQPHITVEIASASSPSVVERSLPLPLSGFFEVNDLPRDKYVVKLAFTLSERTHDFKSGALEADLLASAVGHIGPLKYFAAERTAEQIERCASMGQGGQRCEWR
eukprot:TRINITY_DN908_c0_g2_i1.p1 TRINITY_DN908_c0_g2~~TRINITY_DN908_c0_g2_i1.p1  ORF type:complete len:904 (-),score=223.07 TRINITY_DN908_c0_g2_i1:598-3060(-)